jgi:hypothetical protein
MLERPGSSEATSDFAHPTRHPSGPGRLGLRPPDHASAAWRSGGAAGAVGHPPQRLPGQGERHQPVQGADRRGAGGAAGRASRAWDQAAGPPLRPAAGAADPVAGAPHDRPGVALHRPAHPAAGRRGLGCGPSWSGWSPRWRRGCWSCPGWGRSAPPRCWSAGRTPAGCAHGPPLPPWPGSTRFPRRRGRSPGIDWTVAAIGSSTGRCTPSCWLGSATTPAAAATPLGEGCRARAPGMFAGA